MKKFLPPAPKDRGRNADLLRFFRYFTMFGSLCLFEIYISLTGGKRHSCGCIRAGLVLVREVN